MKKHKGVYLKRFKERIVSAVEFKGRLFLATEHGVWVLCGEHFKRLSVKEYKEAG